jgi:4'-phosphopantetheinyl transferase EntD
MIEQLVPAFVRCAEARGDGAGAPVLDVEQVLISGAVRKRRREFTSARHCARQALAAIGVPPVPILRGSGGEPLWPPGTVGSLSHCDGYRAAAVACAADAQTLGIDAESDAPLPEGVLELVADAGERAQLRQLAASAPAVSWDRLLFSAKESVYKAWYPLMRTWLGFEAAHVEIGRDTGTFTATVLRPAAGCDTWFHDRLEGRWLVEDGLIVTAIVLPVTAAEGRPTRRNRSLTALSSTTAVMAEFHEVSTVDATILPQGDAKG